MREHEYLVHHGILGMHWGVRRSAAQLGRSAAKKTKDSARKGFKNATKKPAYRDSSRLSNEEINETLTRKKLQDDYEAATDPVGSTIKRALNAAAGNALSAVVTPVMVYAGKEAVRMLVGDDEVYKEIYKNNKKK